MRILLWAALMVSTAVGGLLLSPGNVNAQLADSPWPMFHGNLLHTGLSPYATSHVDGTLKWQFEVPDVAPGSPEFESSPAIGEDGAIYIGYGGNNLYAINPDGTEKWNFDVGEPIYDDRFDSWKGVISSPAVSIDGTVYFTSLLNYLFALNPDGTEKWRFKIKRTTDVWSSPAIGRDGTIYVGAARSEIEEGKDISNGLFAVSPDGTLKWKFDNPGDVVASPAIGDDGRIYVGAFDGEEGKGKVYSINPDGSLNWEFTAETYIESSPSIAKDGTIYVGSGSEYLYAVNPDGTEKWRFKADGPEVFSTPAIGKDGVIYFGSGDKNFYALNPDGTKKWHFTTHGSIETSPVLGADGTIYFGTGWKSNDLPNFFAINPDGTVKWSFTTKGGISSSAAIGKDGTVYIASHNGGLYAFGGQPVVGSKEEVTTAESVPKEEEVIQTEKPKQEATPPEKKGVCGPTVLLALALLPLGMRRLCMK